MTQTIRTIRIATQGPAGPAGLYPHTSWSAGSVPYARASVLAHNGGIWLALRDTAVEPSSGTPDDWGSWLDFSGMISGFATLGEDGKIPAAQLPAIAITDTFAAASQAAMLALTAQKGDIAVRSDLNKSFVLAADDPSVLANWKELLTPTDAVLSVAGLTGAIGASALKTALAVAASDVSGLGALATLNVGSGLTGAAGNLSANVTSVAGRTGAVTLTKSDVGLSNVPNVDATARANHTGTQAASTITGLAAVATSGAKADVGLGNVPNTDASNASNIAAGTLPDARLSGNVALLNAAQSFTAQTTFGQGTIATSKPLTVTQTWNASGVTFTGLLADITDTASASASLLLDLKLGGASKFKVAKDGSVTAALSITSGTNINAGGHVIAGAGQGLLINTKGGIFGPSDGVLQLQDWSTGTTFNRLQFGGATASYPAIKRDGAGLAFRLADDSAGTWAKVGSFTVASAPSAATAGAGAIIYVSNESGGATLAFSDGSNWKRTKDLATIS